MTCPSDDALALDEHEGVGADDLRVGTLHNLALTLRDPGSLGEAQEVLDVLDDQELWLAES